MEIRDMERAAIEARLAELKAIGENPEERSDAELQELAEERQRLDAEIARRDKEIEERNALIDEIKDGKIGEEVRAAAGADKEVKEEKPMTINELRESREYQEAFLRMLKKGDDAEVRSLLSDNAQSGGQIPVPTFLENEIKTAWEENKLMSLVKHTNYKGNVKVGFELSATGASIHLEGAAAPEEEVVTIGVVEIKAESLKKWITVSDEALEGTTVDTLGYIYKEIAHKITELAEEILLQKIDAAPTASTATAVAVAEMSVSALDVDTVVMAVSKLSGQARNLNMAMNRGTYAALVSVALKNKYNADVFDGLKDRIVFTDKLKAFGDASASDTVIVIGDFGYGAQANFPNGDEMTIKVDDLSLAEKDLVKIVGRQYVGIAVVAEKAFVRVKKA